MFSSIFATSIYRHRREPPASHIPGSAARARSVAALAKRSGAGQPLRRGNCRTDRAKVNPRARGSGIISAIMGAIDKNHWCNPLWRIGFRKKATRSGGPIVRLPILALAAIAALGLNYGGAHAGRGLPTTD